MQMEAPKPQRDPEFYDEDGRVKDPEIARTMAEVEGYFHKDKEVALEKTSIFRPIEKMGVVQKFNEREAGLRKWMETAPEQIRDREQVIKKHQKEREEELELLRGAPSLLSPEEEAKLWERLDKLANIKILDGFRKSFETGAGKNLEVTGEECSLEDLVTFLESFDRIFMATDKTNRRDAPFYFYPYVKHLNGKSYEVVYCEYDSDLDKLKLGIQTML